MSVIRERIYLVVNTTSYDSNSSTSDLPFGTKVTKIVTKFKTEGEVEAHLKTLGNLKTVKVFSCEELSVVISLEKKDDQ